MVKKLWIFLADREWGNDKMLAAATEEYAKMPPKTEALMNVHEHGGWWLQFYFNPGYPKGIVVGTANDAARFSPEVEKIRGRLANAEFEELGEVRRQTKGAA